MELNQMYSFRYSGVSGYIGTQFWNQGMLLKLVILEDITAHGRPLFMDDNCLQQSNMLFK